MKKITIYLLHLAAAMMLSTAMTSCRQDDLAFDGEGTLPPGSHPISFTASVGSMKSRSQGKNSWKEDDLIGVRTINLNGRKYSMIGCYSLNEEGMMKDIVQRYSVGADGSWNKLDKEPLEWPYPTGKVSAWYPFDPQVDVPLDNQAEKGFDHLDFLSVITDEQSYREVVNLEFQHMMAKVTCRVIPDDGITPAEFESLWLKLQGHTSCTFRETELTGGENIGWITPDSTYSYTEGSLYEALLVPNTMTGKDLISIGLKTNYEGNIIPKYFSYPSPQIEAGQHYIYNIIVKKDRIDVSLISVAWTDEGAGQHPAGQFTFRVNLTDDLVNLINVPDPVNGGNVINTGLVKFSDNVTPILNDDKRLYDKLDVKGNDFTLSIGASAQTRSGSLTVINNEAVNNPRVVNKTGHVDSDCFIENNVFLIADETTIGYEEKINVGDFFFSDGSWSSVLGWNDVSCVGIVFAVNQSDDLSVFKSPDANGGLESDNADNYNFVNTDGEVNPIYTSQRIRGYVLALEDSRRYDFLDSVVMTYPRNYSYTAGTLEFDTKVTMGSTTTIYPAGTSYPSGKLIYDTRAVQYDVTRYVTAFPWSPFTSQTSYYGEMCSLDPELCNGFANMASAKRNEGNVLGNSPVPPFKELEAFAAAEDYEGFFNAPAGTSGWYLPSIKQLQIALSYLVTFTTHLDDSPIVKAGGITPGAYWYWSSTIATHISSRLPGNRAHFYKYQENEASIETIVNSFQLHVRPVLTF